MTTNRLINNYQKRDPLITVVYDLVSCIKENNFIFAYELILKHNLSFSNISLRTQRLKISELAKFADYVICHNKNVRKNDFISDLWDESF